MLKCIDRMSSVACKSMAEEPVGSNESSFLTINPSVINTDYPTNNKTSLV